MTDYYVIAAQGMADAITGDIRRINKKKMKIC